MYKRYLPTFVSCFFLAQGYASDGTEPLEPQLEMQTSYELSPPQQLIPQTQSIAAFTGKISRSKVRMRLQPTLDSTIIRELETNDLVIVSGEAGDFYAIEAPEDIKAYIFRTYVLDGVIEGNRVNVRLEPDLGAPVIAQLNSGDPVKGMISSSDKKWMEITPPASTRFYVAREYVERIGDATMLSKIKRRREEVSMLLANARSESQTELEKPYEQIHFEPIVQKLNTIIKQYADFSQEVAQAQELLNSIHAAYLNKKVAYMETAVRLNQQEKPAPQMAPKALSSSPIQGPPTITGKMSTWLSKEQNAYEEWVSKQSEKYSQEEFYQQQEQGSVELHGLIEPYTRSVKNKPGDYILMHPVTHLPIGYLYSTVVNLQERIGQEITVKVATRNNYNFAYPAYFVLSIE